MSDPQSAQQLASIHSRQKNVNNKIIQYQTELKSVSAQLEELWVEVRAEYNVDNLEDLRGLYKKLESERSAKISNADKELLEIEQIINTIESSLAMLNS